MADILISAGEDLGTEDVNAPKPNKIFRESVQLLNAYPIPQGKVYQQIVEQLNSIGGADVDGKIYQQTIQLLSRISYAGAIYQQVVENINQATTVGSVYSQLLQILSDSDPSVTIFSQRIQVLSSNSGGTTYLSVSGSEEISLEETLALKYNQRVRPLSSTNTKKAHVYVLS